MYQVTVETLKKGSTESDVLTYSLGEIDTEAYEKVMGELADVLFNLDIEFDDVEGDGDIMVDDILISVSEEEPFEKRVAGRKHEYIIKGFENC